LLVAFWIGLLASLQTKSQTVDEGVHLSAGYTFWQYNDYRLNPENGNLPQRLMALPLLFGDYKFPEVESESWKTSDKWAITWQWLYQLGNDAEAMTRRGRAAIGLLAVALGALVWAWSRQLFGPLGGILSLLLYVFNPSILANGALMTSDLVCTLFFFAATWTWWRLLQRMTPARIFLSALAAGALFLSKASAVLILPIAFLLVIGRLLHGTALPVRGFGRRELRSRIAQLLGIGVAGAVHAVVVLLLIWAFHGFRYTAFSPATPEGTWAEATWETLLGKPSPHALFERVGLGSMQREEVARVFAREHADENTWPVASLKAIEAVKREVLAEEQVSRLEQLLAEPPPQLFPRTLETLRRYHMLPEAYIYGLAHVWRSSRERAAFFNGEFSLSGWPTFFPYTFLVKTPLPAFAIIMLAAAAAVARWRSRSGRAGLRGFGSMIYDTLPLWVLFAVYWIAAITSHLNIGHRHILPVYPPLFVLCGAAAYWFHGWPGVRRGSQTIPPFSRAAATGLYLALALLAAETVYRFPHYLAYFNGLVRPADAYRHLVDSSLDWGQDLPGVRRYIETKHPAPPVYLSYFGFASQAYHRVPAIYIYSMTGAHRLPPLQTFTLPADQSDQLLQDFLRREPEYQGGVVGTAREGDKVFAVVVKKPGALRLSAGTYFISATLLQPVTQPGKGAFGSWNDRLEKEYQRVREFITPLLSDDPAERSAALPQFPAGQWYNALEYYDFLRFYRLAAFLRQREPDDNVGFSILVYRLNDEDLARALDGPPVELGRDMTMELYGRRP